MSDQEVIYHSFSYEDRHIAKSKGYRWDPDERSWYSIKPKTKRNWQDYSYERRGEAKLAGCKWCPDEKKWYLPDNNKDKCATCTIDTTELGF